MLKYEKISFLVSVVLLGGCSFQESSTTTNKPKTVVKKNEVCTKTADCPACAGNLDRAAFLLAQAKNQQTANKDWPMFGGTPSRNMVNLVEKNPPTNCDVDKKTNIKWVAQLGNISNGGPVISGGKVYVATNNARERKKDEKIKHKAVLMCFRELDGNFLWKAEHVIPNTEVFSEGLEQGLCSTPVVEGERIYYVTPTCVLICAKTTDGTVDWQYDMMAKLKVVPYHLGNCSPLIHGDHVFVVTSNGVSNEGKVVSPNAPSFIAVNKKTGSLKWQSNLPGANIIEGQWSNPTLAMVGGKAQVIFPGGDAWIYSFEPESGKLIWKFNCHPGRKKAKDGDDPDIPNYIISTAVVVGNNLYIGLGLYPGHGQPTPHGRILCIDVTKSGDVSPKDYNPKTPKGKNSALVWQFGGKIEPRPKLGRSVYIGRTISTCAVHDGLVYIPEENGYLHCLDANTGKRYWMHDLLTAVWGSAMWIDGKVYLGTEEYEVIIFAHGKEKKIIAKMELEDQIHSTPVMANGVMFVTTRSKLYAIAAKK